ncbi:MAG TPA: hypothetical protein VFP10_00965, partial [Candidatus Eisenbacteria bacterium]|nr:hypothetical protein [Candidatus Eisenbacteria bacterium]
MNEVGGWKRPAQGIFVALLAFVAVMIMASLVMPRVLWGMAAATDLSPGLLALIMFVAVFVSISPNWVETWLTRLGRGTAPAIALALVLMLSSWIGRIRLHWLGDQSIWLRSFQLEDTYHVLEPVSFALMRASANAVREGAILLSVLLGAFFALFTWLLSGELERASPGRRAWLWLMLLFTPQLLFFRGYVESYPLLLLSLILLAWILLRVMRGDSMHWAWSAALVGAAAHVMGTGALPALVYANWRRRRWIAVSGACLLAIVVAVWVLSHRSRWPANFGPLRMTLAVFDLRSAGWEGFLSGRHLLGIANVLLLLGGPLLFTVPCLPWRAWWRAPASRVLVFLIAPGFFALLVVRLILGPVRDWDLFASYLYFMTPALATAWLARSPGNHLPRYSSALLALAFAHSAFWSSVDMDVERGLRRAARLYGQDSIYAPEARARAAEDLAVVERARGNPAGAERWYELATIAMPKHWRYQYNLGSLAQTLGHGEKAKQAFTNAVALRPP